RAGGGDRVRLLTLQKEIAAAAPTPAAAPKPPAPSGGGAPAATKESAPPWKWSVAAVHVTDARVRTLGALKPLDAQVNLTLADLAGDSEASSPIKLAVVTEHGALDVDGEFRLKSPAFAGRVRLKDLELPEVGSVAAVLPPSLLQSAKLATDMTVEAGMAAADGAALSGGDVRLRGQ